MAAPKGNKFAKGGRKPGATNLKNRLGIHKLGAMLDKKLTPDLIATVASFHPELIIKYKIEIEKILNPQKHEIELGATATKLVERLNRAIERTG